MKLYSYYRSSASYRVRIALNLKGVTAAMIPVNLLKAEHKAEAYRKINPQGLLPTLVDGDYHLSQSLAIMEYLEETYPQPPLLPQTRAERARVRALALTIACEIAPLCNSGPMGFLAEQYGCNESDKTKWYHHWMHKGFTAIEQNLQSGDTGSFCHGSTPTIADCCLVPQIYNAYRYNVDMTPYPTMLRIAANCEKLPAFIAAHPSKQVDAV